MSRINKLRFAAIAASLFIMLFISACSSSNGGGTSTGGPIVTEDGKVTRDTLVSFIRHYGKLNVRNITLRQEIDINDTSKIKKLLGDYYPLWLDKHLNRILKVPYEATVTIGFDLGEIALSVKETGENKFSVSKPTPIVDITNLIIRFDQEYRDIGTLRSDIETGEFNAAWQEKMCQNELNLKFPKSEKMCLLMLFLMKISIIY